jgi:peptide/nickel transport system ATP-binding protein
MRQRITIAIALACNPDLIVMDEPTTAVDVIIQRQILAKILELQQVLGFAVIFVTHDLTLLLEFADRIAVMYAGRIVEIGPADRIYEQPRHPYTEGLRDSFPPLRGVKTALTGIAGSPPNPQQPLPGCPFAPRCHRRMEICDLEAPPAQTPDGDLCACWLHVRPTVAATHDH